MAIEAKISSQLRLVFHEGDDMESGKPILKSKNFNQVKTEATASQLHEIAEALASLQDFPLYGVERRDNSEIKEA